MSETVTVHVPQANPNDEHAVLVCWHVQSGTRVEVGQPLATLETTKANFDLESPAAGYAHFNCAPSTMVSVGAAIAWIGPSQTPPAQMTAESTPQSVRADETGGNESRFTRKALKLMRERGLTPADFQTAGRVDTEEVERVAREGSASGTRPASGDTAPSDAQPLKQSPSKLLEVQALVDVYRQIVPSAVTVSLSCEQVEARLRELSARIGPISLLELALYEVARLLEDFPDLNGYYAGGRAWCYRETAIGFAINLGRSLRVPVVRDAALLEPLQIAQRVRDLSLRYLRDELTVEDLTGGSFTITDLSGQGVEHFIPVVNQRQSAILGICGERPGSGRRDVVLAFDHRMSDGMRAAQFLGALRERLEQSNDSPPAQAGQAQG